MRGNELRAVLPGLGTRVDRRRTKTRLGSAHPRAELGEIGVTGVEKRQFVRQRGPDYPLVPHVVAHFVSAFDTDLDRRNHSSASELDRPLHRRDVGIRSGDVEPTPNGQRLETVVITESRSTFIDAGARLG
jgi:hypothetical protein